jgi:Cof subfamily protein (haloacid dehalogenase superfamily)
MSRGHYKLLVTDLDGTLVDSSGQIHRRDRIAIEALLERGVFVSLCTGRMYSGTRDIARTLGLKTAVGCVDGSHIVHSVDDRDLLLRAIESAAALALYETLAEIRPVSFVFADDTVLYDAAGVEFLPYINTWSERSIALEDAIEEARTRRAMTTSGVVSLGTESQIKSIVTELDRRAPEALQTVTFPVRRTAYTGMWGMVVRAAGATKGTAIEWIARHEGVSLSETIAVGDWLNDVPMFEAAGRSFAMAHAPEEVKAAASEVLEADVIRGGGIEEAAEKAGLL